MAIELCGFNVYWTELVKLTQMKLSSPLYTDLWWKMYQKAVWHLWLLQNSGQNVALEKLSEKKIGRKKKIPYLNF